MPATASKWTFVRYTAERRALWDSMARQARQGSFLFLRSYMDYEAAIVADHSLFCLLNGKPLALLPATTSGATLTSHGGLTYGGLLSSEKLTAAHALSLMQALLSWLADKGISTFVYRPVPYIYQTYPADEDLYALFRLGFRLAQRRISSALPLQSALNFSQLRRRHARKAENAGISVVADERFDLFWPVLEKNLAERHNTRPVHTLAEIQLLHRRLPGNIVLHRATDRGGNTLAGTVLYVCRNVVHAQYIGSTQRGREQGAVDILFQHVLHDTKWSQQWFDFGNSVEQGGLWLNEGLIFQKEGFGGRAVCYDTYEKALAPRADGKKAADKTI